MRPSPETWLQAGTESNRRRAQTAGHRRAEAIRQLLAESSVLLVDAQELIVLRLRADHPDKSLAELGAIVGLTKYGYASALRRTLLRLGAW